MSERIGRSPIWAVLGTCYAASLFLPPSAPAGADSTANPPADELRLMAHIEESTDAAGEIDDDLAYEDQRTKVALLDMLAVTKLDPGEHPEIARALGYYGSLNVAEQIQRRKEVMAAVPSMQPVKKSESYISSDFGERDSSFSKAKQFHKGLDLAGPDGVAIYAPADGIVRYAARYGRYGNYISVVHGYGFVTKFAHIDQMLVKAGQFVRRGDKIATMGKTGRVTGTHLHYEVWLNDQAVDPQRFMYETPETMMKQQSMTVANVEASGQ